MTSTLPATWIRIAVIYFVIAVALGVFMGASHDHSLFSLHAHLNLLGWVSMALFGVVGKVFPEITTNLLAKLHFWIYNASLPVMAIALFAVLKGNASMEPVLGMVSATTAVAILLFALNVLMNLQARDKRQVEPASTNDSGLLAQS